MPGASLGTVGSGVEGVGGSGIDGVEGELPPLGLGTYVGKVGRVGPEPKLGLGGCGRLGVGAGCGTGWRGRRSLAGGVGVLGPGCPPLLSPVEPSGEGE